MLTRLRDALLGEVGDAGSNGSGGLRLGYVVTLLYPCTVCNRHNY